MTNSARSRWPRFNHNERTPIMEYPDHYPDGPHEDPLNEKNSIED